MRPTTVVVGDKGENQMDKKWLSKLAADVEARHGKNARDREY